LADNGWLTCVTDFPISVTRLYTGTKITSKTRSKWVKTEKKTKHRISRGKAKEVLKQKSKAAASAVVVEDADMKHQVMKGKFMGDETMNDAIVTGKTTLLMKMISLITKGIRNTKYPPVVFPVSIAVTSNPSQASYMSSKHLAVIFTHLSSSGVASQKISRLS